MPPSPCAVRDSRKVCVHANVACNAQAITHFRHEQQGHMRCPKKLKIEPGCVTSLIVGVARYAERLVVSSALILSSLIVDTIKIADGEAEVRGLDACLQPRGALCSKHPASRLTRCASAMAACCSSRARALHPPAPSAAPHPERDTGGSCGRNGAPGLRLEMALTRTRCTSPFGHSLAGR